MIDLDAYIARVVAEADAEPDPGNASGMMQALNILEDMRAEALPDPSVPSLPAMNGSATTQAMRRAAWPRSGSLRREIISAVAQSAAGGLTDDALERMLGRSHQSVSAARHGLVSDGWLTAATYPNRTRITRRTRSGNPAQVWCLTPPARIRLRAGAVR